MSSVQGTAAWSRCVLTTEHVLGVVVHLTKSAMHRPCFVACLKQQPTSPVLTLSASRITLAHCPLQGLSAQDSRGRGWAVSWLRWRGQHKVVWLQCVKSNCVKGIARPSRGECGTATGIAQQATGDSQPLGHFRVVSASRRWRMPGGRVRGTGACSLQDSLQGGHRPG